MFSILFINLLTKKCKSQLCSKSLTLVKQKHIFSVNVIPVQECPTSVVYSHLFFANHLQKLTYFHLCPVLGQGHSFGSVLLSTLNFILQHVIDFFSH